MHFKAMLPRLGELFPDAIEVVTKPRQEYQTMAYAELGLPKAPAIMVGGECITEGKDIEESALEMAIRRHLGEGRLLTPQPNHKEEER